MIDGHSLPDHGTLGFDYWIQNVSRPDTGACRHARWCRYNCNSGDGGDGGGQINVPSFLLKCADGI